MKKFGIGSYIVGSAQVENESFKFKLPANITPGVYRFQYDVQDAAWIDIIINGKEQMVSFTFDTTEAMLLPNFDSSTENYIWYQHIQKERMVDKTIALLNKFIASYPDKNAIVTKAALADWEQKKNNYFYELENFKMRMKNTMAYDMVINKSLYFGNPLHSDEIQQLEKRKNFWNNINTTNPKLINTPLYTELILDYLSYWINPKSNDSPNEKIDNLKKEVDLLMRVFSGNKETIVFLYQYLVLGFNEIGEEAILQYLDENYKN
jgi:hypothetical protein